jgi:serine/threonine protein phosphatase PrpC
MVSSGEPDTLVPLEEMQRAPGPRRGLIAGTRETEDLFSLHTPVAGASLHTSKGVGYKSYNEDSGALLADARGRIYVGVFDQAGGQGFGAEQRGAASAIAARRFWQGMREAALEEVTAEALGGALKAAALAAHHQILARGYDEATTFLAGRIDRSEATLLCVGDSGGYHFRRGKLLVSTRRHRLPPPLPQNVLTDALGQSTGLPALDVYRWRVQPGDVLVMGSDGLLDALEPEEIGEVVSADPTPSTAARRLVGDVYFRMSGKRAKSDNVTIAVITLR